jgi:hypothetical protein
MKSIKSFFCFLLATFIFISCERDVVFDGQITNPSVVVNSYITPDSVVSAYISLSRFFLKDSTEFHFVDNAEVNLWVNGILKEKLSPYQNGIYKGTYKPVITDQLKLTIDVPQMQQVTTTAAFPETPIILAIDTQKVFGNIRYISFGPGSNDTVAISRNYKVNYKLSIKDNGNQNNYYRLLVRSVSFTGIWNYNTNKIDTIEDIRLPQYSNFDFTDVVSGNIKDPLADTGTSPVGELLSNPTNIFNVFSDEIFNGKTYTLKFSTNETTQHYFSIDGLRYSYSSGNILKNKVYIILESISKEYYQYLRTRSASSATNYFSEPVQVYTNIKGGIGILGSYTSSNIVEFDLP